MSPQSAKPLEQIPGTLFERELPPPPEVIDGCFTSVIVAVRRLADVLDHAPAGSLSSLPRLRLTSLLFECDRLTYRLRAEHPLRRPKWTSPHISATA